MVLPHFESPVSGEDQAYIKIHRDKL